MDKAFFAILGLLFWLVLTGWSLSFLPGLPAVLLGILVVSPKVRSQRMVLFTGRLLFSFVKALYQAFALMLCLYDHRSRFSTELAGSEEEELFEKTVLITLTPRTLVVQDAKGELLVHALEGRK